MYTSKLAAITRGSVVEKISSRGPQVGPHETNIPYGMRQIKTDQGQDPCISEGQDEKQAYM